MFSFLLCDEYDGYKSQNHLIRLYMSISETNNLINDALVAYQGSLSNATLTLERQLKKALTSSEVAGGVEQFKIILDVYLKENRMDLGTLAMLSGLSPNTMTRLKKSVESSRVETVSAVLDIMGMELVIARRGQADA